MADVVDRLKNVRTLEDVVNLLTILFTNLNNQNEIYYDMFLNPTPMDLELERYDENGELVTVVLANRAKDRISALSGSGSPNGVKVAPIGSLYIDTSAGDLYFKASGTDAYGWILVWTARNFTEGSQYISPTGDASRLTNLNMNNAGSGTLPVIRGGSGVNTITGPIQGNGTAPFSTYSGGGGGGGGGTTPSDFLGMIMYYPKGTIPSGFLICNGAAVSRSTYSALFDKLGTTYGSGDGSTTFNLPNLIGRYIKGGLPQDVGATGNAHVGAHSHGLQGSTGSESAHKHDPGTLNSTGKINVNQTGINSPSGALSISTESTNANHGSGTFTRKSTIAFNLASGWVSGCKTGSGSAHNHSLDGLSTKSAGSGTNDVDHIVMVPVIKY